MVIAKGSSGTAYDVSELIKVRAKVFDITPEGIILVSLKCSEQSAAGLGNLCPMQHKPHSLVLRIV